MNKKPLADEAAELGYTHVARALRALSSPGSPRETVPTPGLISAMARSIEAQPPASPRVKTRRLKTKVAAASFGGMVLLGGGLAFAGELPGAAQDVASQMLAKVGISVPAGDNANSHSNTRGKSAEHSNEADHDNGGKGFEVTSTVNNTSPGLERGKAVSEEASDGHSVTGTANAEEHAVTGTANSTQGKQHRP